ncbi:MAG: hypothetical protein BJ554DRAFT_1639, partial [Olpidium bornovanus]
APSAEYAGSGRHPRPGRARSPHLRSAPLVLTAKFRRHPAQPGQRPLRHRRRDSGVHHPARRGHDHYTGHHAGVLHSLTAHQRVRALGELCGAKIPHARLHRLFRRLHAGRVHRFADLRH